MRVRIAIVLAAVLAAVGLLSGCSSERTQTDPPVTMPAPTETISHGRQGEGPPPFVVRYGGMELRLAASGWCYQSSCADGLDMDPPSVGSPDEVLVFLPGTDFKNLAATQFTGERYACESRSLEANVEDLGDGWWQLHPQGPADDYTFDLFASGGGPLDFFSFGASSADMSASLRWSTTEDAPMPRPTASLVLIVEADGKPASYGVELSIAGLAQHPTEYSALITVTAANGKSLTFAAEPADECTGIGWIYFDGPDDKGVEAAQLGGFPFTYDVELTLDGKFYRATATYADNSGGIDTPLEFTPALP